jgi:hypothetical protein
MLAHDTSRESLNKASINIILRGGGSCIEALSKALSRTKEGRKPTGGERRSVKSGYGEV